MSKPWDNEPTPLTDAVAKKTGLIWFDPVEVWRYARNLERRMLAAERLLDRAMDGWVDPESFTGSAIITHLKATQKEIGK